MRLLIVITLLFLFSCQKWSKPEYYSLNQMIEFNAEFRTMAEHDSLMKGKNWPYIFEFKNKNAGLIYYGSWHTNDPENKQIPDIVQRWNDFSPTVAVMENRPGFYFWGLESAVKSHSEFGALKHLSLNSDVKFYTLEPSWKDEITDALSKFNKKDLTVFYTLRVFQNEKKTENPEDYDSLAEHLLSKRGNREGLKGSFNNLTEFNAWWNKHYSQLGDWRNLNDRMLWPKANSENKLQKMSTHINQCRDRHAARVIIDLLKKGERVFAIAGGSHVVKQEPVIRAAFSAGNY